MRTELASFIRYYNYGNISKSLKSPPKNNQFFFPFWSL